MTKTSKNWQRTNIRSRAHLKMDPFIMDVGAHDGSDTAYYLSLGYRVVAIEADPVKVDALKARFGAEIDSGRLSLVNTGVGDATGVLPFFRCKRDSGSSSFDPAWFHQEGGETIEIAVRPLVDVIKEVGTPYYLKCDIEGFDYKALSTLQPQYAPKYISAEVQNHPEILDLFVRLGYRHFKLLAQPYHTPSEKIYDHEIGWRLLRKLSQKIPVLHSVLKSLPQRLRPKTEWEDPKEGSGPFGEDTPGLWLDETQVRSKLKRVMHHAEKSNGRAWSDLHARL
jgi:FkbM family methyltransferase